MQNLLFKGYLILAYLSFFEVNPWLWIQVPSFFKRPFLVWNCYTRKKKKKKNITILVRHLEREAKITGKKFAGDRRSPNCILSLLGKEM